ncbi:hypothetical protein F4779DRAFT_635724 [Xylariaceae sp. FL0662B]|nr:hypothetical protein F4779DRAFT_635724 [Xylariaceae sp. FL0662B]
MNQDREVRSSPIEGLPVELVRAILSELPDVESLQAAVLSCPLFYCAFLQAETAITAQVLLNQIDVSVLPEAVAASESSSLRPHDTKPESREAIVTFATQYLQRRPTPPKSWSLQKALHISRLHFYVDGLAKKFTSELLNNSPLNQSKSIATHQEICRVERALYRFEIYCNLFRESNSKLRPRRFSRSSVCEEQQQLFFANFSPLEKEQLGCIQEFLVRVVSPAFNDIAEHDIHWGLCHVEYDVKVDSYYIQHVLSLGLEKLYQIAAAETYEGRYRLLDPPHANGDFLHEGLEDANEKNDGIFLGDLTPEEEIRHVKQPLFADPDSGPADAWRWAHQEESRSNWVYQENRQDLRQWGYVMWDRSRLDEIGVFQEPWEEREISLEEKHEAIRQHAYMENSWDQRENMSRMGASGWWSWGDRSKVVWPSGRGPSHHAPTKPYSRQVLWG